MDIIEFLKEKHNILLNEQQQKGVLSIEKNLLLLAVPGSGKTTVLVSRIANLIVNHNVNAETMLSLTYNKETAKDMSRRFSLLFGDITSAVPTFRTIHSFCFMVMKFYAQALNRQMPKLISESESGQKSRALREIYMKHNQEYLTDDIMETFDKQISYTKNMMIDSEGKLKIDKGKRHFREIFDDYEQYKKANHLIDYDDMLTYTYDIFIKVPQILQVFQRKFQYVNVDEAQDTSLIQHKIIKLLTGGHKIFMVGDEDQSIYSFRGAYPQALLEFNKEFADSSIIKMEQNFRSNSDIVSHANEFIKQNKKRYTKEMFCSNKEKTSIKVIKLKDYQEQYKNALDYIKKHQKNKTIAIIYRNNDSAIPMLDLLYKNNINFYIKDHRLSYFTCSVIRDIIAYVRLSQNPCDMESFRQIYFKLGLTKNIFTFVEQNIDSYSDIFTCVMDIQALTDFKKGQMSLYKSGFKRLSSMNPKRAIRYIQEELGYQQYIDKCMADGFTKTNTFQKFNTAICLAKNIDTLDEYMLRLSELQTLFHDKKNIDKSSNVILATFHSSKGLEFDTVIMLDIIKDIIPTSEAVKSQLEGDFAEIENETRLFYVGVTRAKSELIFYKSNFLNGNITMPSRFIDRFVNDTVAHQVLGNKPINVTVEDMTSKKIQHIIFGEGTIEAQIDDTLLVEFKGGVERKISYSACVDAGLIEIEK